MKLYVTVQFATKSRKNMPAPCQSALRPPPRAPKFLVSFYSAGNVRGPVCPLTQYSVLFAFHKFLMSVHSTKIARGLV